MVQAGSEMLLNGKVLDGSTIPGSGMLVPADKFTSKYNLLVGKTVVDPSNEHVPIRVLNVSDKSVTVYRKTLVEHCETVSVDELSTSDHPVNTESRDIPVFLADLIQRSSSSLSEGQVNALKVFLSNNCDVFAESKLDLGRTDVVTHGIDVSNAEPFRQRPRRLPFAQRENAASQIDSMLKQDVIERSNSPWASPIVLVKKKDGSLRFCIDYRKLNSITKKDSFSVSRIDDKLDALVGSQWFCTLDLQCGYW